MTPRHPYLDHPFPIPFAHRGGALDGPENTMRAFAAAYDLGYRHVETDVHTTADGVLVAFHDDVLDRVTDRSGRVAELPWDEVRRARIAGTEPIPLFEDLLGTWPDVRVNIDAKHDGAVDALVETIQRTGALDRVCMGSFSGARLQRLRSALGPGLCTSMGPWDALRLRLASYGAPVGPFDALCAQVPPRHKGVRVVDRRFVRAAHARGIAVHVWTIDEPEEMERLLDLGVDGLMTDRPATLKTVLERRGLWVSPA